MLTKQDRLLLIQDFKGVFATKVDFEHFVTKEDLDEFAKKSDLARFATKEDLKDLPKKLNLDRFATKDDLKSLATKQDHSRDVRDLMMLMEAQRQELLGEIRASRIEMRESFTKVLQDHEVRLQRLEK